MHIVIRDLRRRKKNCSLFDFDHPVSVLSPVPAKDQADLVVCAPVVWHFFRCTHPGHELIDAKNIKMSFVLIDIVRDQASRTPVEIFNCFDSMDL